jgi:hypothetical protein
MVTRFKSISSNGMASAFSNSVKRAVLSVLLLACLLAPLPSATLERLSLNQMILASTAIVRAKVTSSYAAFSGPIIYTHYQIRVSETLKGSSAGAVEFVVQGGVANNLRQTFSGVPQFSVGDEYVFFLWTGKRGVTQIMGLTQGLFSVAQDGSANPTTTRSANHEVMLQRGTGQQVKDQTLVMTMSQLRAQIAATMAGKGAN